ncbi:uncharacterized protein LOC120081033 [Benincasa hispida]|uniref:uncharacterized protein LOC120081033 n=1 Tax=Benincasa hispida TaxID=102211 RepID=UPI00190040BF|nr:uncharacterized protein LOC120081033 [Benincasa hispida]
MNPHIVIHWRLNEVDCDERIVMFNSVSWSFGLVIEGFKHYRPLLQIDGTHLYGKYEGTLLIATSVDANGHVYSIAYAIVPEESADSWGWFFRNLWDHVVHGREGMCLILNRHKDIISTIRNPNNGWIGVHHRFCLRHVESNFNDRYKNSLLKSLVYSAGSKFQVRKFNDCMVELQTANPNCLRYFSSIDPKQWTQSHDGGHRYGWLTTNVAKSTNVVLKEARKLPITALVQATFYRIIAYFAACRVEIETVLESGEYHKRYSK